MDFYSVASSRNFAHGHFAHATICLSEQFALTSTGRSEISKSGRTQLDEDLIITT